MKNYVIVQVNKDGTHVVTTNGTHDTEAAAIKQAEVFAVTHRDFKYVVYLAISLSQQPAPAVETVRLVKI